MREISLESIECLCVMPLKDCFFESIIFAPAHEVSRSINEQFNVNLSFSEDYVVITRLHNSCISALFPVSVDGLMTILEENNVFTGFFDLKHNPFIRSSCVTLNAKLFCKDEDVTIVTIKQLPLFRKAVELFFTDPISVAFDDCFI
jgi:hypothetical protein